MCKIAYFLIQNIPIPKSNLVLEVLDQSFTSDDSSISPQTERTNSHFREKTPFTQE